MFRPILNLRKGTRVYTPSKNILLIIMDIRFSLTADIFVGLNPFGHEPFGILVRKLTRTSIWLEKLSQDWSYLSPVISNLSRDTSNPFRVRSKLSLGRENQSWIKLEIKCNTSTCDPSIKAGPGMRRTCPNLMEFQYQTLKALLLR